MQDRLKEKLWTYIAHNHPDLLLRLQQGNSITRYLNEKVSGVEPLISRLQEERRPAYLVEEICLEELIRELEPSRFNYVRGILEDEFEPDFLKIQQSGALTYEVLNLMSECEPAFESLGFTAEAELNRRLRYAVTGTIRQYLDGN